MRRLRNSKQSQCTLFKLAGLLNYANVAEKKDWLTDWQQQLTADNSGDSRQKDFATDEA